MIEIRKRDGESMTSALFRFTKRVQQTGVLKESKKRRFRARPANRNRRRASAIRRESIKKEILRERKAGTYTRK